MWFYSQSTFGIFLFVCLFFVYMPVIGEASKNLPTNCPYTPLSPPPTQTHAHRVPLKTAFHSLHIQTHNSSVTSHSRGTAATLHFILKLTKQQKKQQSNPIFLSLTVSLFSHTASSCCPSFCPSISRSKHLLLSFLSSTVSLAFPPPFLLSCLGMSNYY